MKLLVPLLVLLAAAATARIPGEPLYPDIAYHDHVASSAASAAAAPVVTDMSPRFGPPGQWIYLYGSGFDPDVEVFLIGEGNTTVSPAVYSSSSIGFTLPEGTFTFVKAVVRTKLGEAAGPLFTVGIPTGSPRVLSFSADHGKPGCYLYVAGVDFVVGQTEARIRRKERRLPPDQRGIGAVHASGEAATGEESSLRHAAKRDWGGLEWSS